MRPQRAGRALGRRALHEQAVDGRPGARDVGAEGAPFAAAPRRAARRRDRSAEARRGRAGGAPPASASSSAARRSAKPSRAAALVEGGVDVGGRALRPRRAEQDSTTQKSCGSSSGSSVGAGCRCRAPGPERRKNGTSAPKLAASACSALRLERLRQACGWRAGARTRRRSSRRRDRTRPGCASRSGRASGPRRPRAAASRSSAARTSVSSTEAGRR